MDTSRGPPARRHSTVPTATLRRGSYEEACLRPHLRNLAHRRRSAPSLAFGMSLGMPWSPIREEASCWPSLEQCPFVLGLSSQNGELLLDQRVKVTEGNKTMDLHLFLFNDVLVFAKLKSTASYRLKYRVGLGDVLVYSFEDANPDDEDDGDDEDAGGDVYLRVTLVLTWASTFCVVSFCSPGMKECWLDTLHRKTIEARATSGVTTPTPQALMKVLSGTIPTKTLSGDGMESFIEFPSDDDMKLHVPGTLMSNKEDRLTQPIENGGRWNLIRRLMKSLSGPESNSGTQLFGQPLSKICPDTRSLPKPVNDMLVLLRTKGPVTEGVFRKPGNRRVMREVREQLHAGQPVDLGEKPVVLLATLLKCFLQELPGSLLVSDLYVLWVKALDTDEGQKRSLQIKSVLGQLPVHNRLLLQQLLSTFHHILERSDINKMDAYNLAVCIAPTLLQLNATSIGDQKDQLEKVTELTQYLIEHSCELLGEEVHPLLPLFPSLLGDAEDENSDASASQLQDSAYDSPDPDAEGCMAGSSQSLPCSSTTSSTDTNASTVPSCRSEGFSKPSISRRCSEPILKALCPPVEAIPRADLSCLARSQDDCFRESRGGYEQQPLRKQISDDSVLLRAFAEPEAHTLLEGGLLHAFCSSTCSLESATSNLSDGSVFSSSPLPSPTCQPKWSSICQPRWGATPRSEGGPIPDSEGNRRSQSMKLDGKVTVNTLRRAGGFSFRKGSLRAAKEASKDMPSGTLPKDSQPGTMRRPRPLSAIEVFQMPCRPPSYEQAVQSTGLPAAPHFPPLTVQDAQREQIWRTPRRSASISDDFLLSCPVNRYADSFFSSALAAEEDQDEGREGCRHIRQRATSESVYRVRFDTTSRKCSQSTFEEYSYAKESYV